MFLVDRTIELIKDEIESVSNLIINGNVNTFDSYKYYCGLIKGLNASLICIEKSEEELRNAK